MLAALTDKAFSNKGWIFERKFDGERCLAFRDDGDVRLLSRNRSRRRRHRHERSYQGKRH
jgi:bifunctional non-homologous end joining protein LigD